jgi:hypothetical protein
MERGVVYMAWGDNARQQAETSIRSLWRYAPGMPVLVVGDEPAVAHFSVFKHVSARTIDVDPFDFGQRNGWKFLAGRIKPLLYELSPFEKTLYVDADSEFCASPDRGFALLERWDFVVAESRFGCVGDAPFLPTEREETAAWLGTPLHIFHNSGMLFWKRCPEVAELMQLWSEEWQRYGDWDEQIALLRALMRSQTLFLTVPFDWNTNLQERATLLFHAYGTHAARIEERRSTGAQKSAFAGRNRVIANRGRPTAKWRK